MPAKTTALKPKAKRSKYGAVPTMIEGVRHDSKHEAAWATKLRMLERATWIENLELNKAALRYVFIHNGVKLCTYEADARFTVRQAFHLPHKNGGSYVEPGQEIVVDVKGVRTPAYVIKRKLMKAFYGIDVVEL